MRQPLPSPKFRHLRAVAAACALLGCLNLLAPFIYAFAFCFPAGDDFDEASRAMFLFDLPGGLYEAAREWLAWSGRYSYHFLAVFLGRAAESRLVEGPLCLAILALNGLAAQMLAKTCGCSTARAFFFGLLSLLALCACHQRLPVFYLLTDALTSGLQCGAFLLFLAFLCRLWRKLEIDEASGAKTCFQACLCGGAFAIGIYEHAALAVFFASLSALVLALARKPWQQMDKNMLRKARAAFAKPFLRLWLWLSLALAFSFLAPGNFRRRAMRGVDENLVSSQLENVWSAWLDLLTDFFQSPWPLAILCLVSILAFLVKNRDDSPKAELPAFFAIFLCLAMFCLFAFGLALLHAVSDVPIGAAPKLSASSGFFGAIALAFALYPALARAAAGIFNFPLEKPARFSICAIALFCLFAITAHGDNFRKTGLNAANGQMLQYALFMEKRLEWLKKLGQAGPAAEKPRFGLAGELFHKGRRLEAINPAWRKAIVPAFQGEAFPLAYGEQLSPGENVWPNIWLAWLYGLKSVECAKPDPLDAARLAALGQGVELALPENLREKGLDSAWRVKAPLQGNEFFTLDWLALRAPGGMKGGVHIMRPNPPDFKRLEPMFLQEYWLSGLAGIKKLEIGWPPRLIASSLFFEADLWRSGEYYAFPLGPAAPGDGKLWPDILFFSLSGGEYDLLRPYL